MYILIRIGLGGTECNIMVSKYKKDIVKHLKDLGYYWSKSYRRYIDDKTKHKKDGSGQDYIIEEIELLKK